MGRFYWHDADRHHSRLKESQARHNHDIRKKDGGQLFSQVIATRRDVFQQSFDCVERVRLYRRIEPEPFSTARRSYGQLRANTPTSGHP